MHQHGPLPFQHIQVAGLQVQSMGQQAVLVNQAEMVQTLHHRWVALLHSVGLVGPVLRQVNMQAPARLLVQNRAHPLERPVGKGKRSVQPQQRLDIGVGGELPPGRQVLFQRGLKSLLAVAVGGLESQRHIQPQPPGHCGQLVQGAPHETGAGVVIDDSGDPRPQRIYQAHFKRRTGGLGVQCPVQPPPHPLQDFLETGRRLLRRRHTQRQGRIQMGMGIDHPRQDGQSRKVD